MNTSTIKKPQTSDIIDLHFNQHLVSYEVAKKLGISKVWVVEDVIQRVLNKKIQELTDLKKAGSNYTSVLVMLVKYYREVQSLPYYEISNILGLTETEVYDIVFFYEVTPHKDGYVKNSLSREEKAHRDEAMTTLNREQGLTLRQIAATYHITKQRVSTIFRHLGYKPVTSQVIKEVSAGKYKKEFEELQEGALINKLNTLRKEVRSTKQRASVAKYHYNKMVIGLRCKLITAYINDWHDEYRPDYIANRRVLITIYNEVGDTPVYTEEIKTIKSVLEKVVAFEKTGKVKVAGNKLLIIK